METIWPKQNEAGLYREQAGKMDRIGYKLIDGINADSFSYAAQGLRATIL